VDLIRPPICLQPRLAQLQLRAHVFRQSPTDIVAHELYLETTQYLLLVGELAITLRTGVDLVVYAILCRACPKDAVKEFGVQSGTNGDTGHFRGPGLKTRLFWRGTTAVYAR
jgi:hypothetical protein